jgi:hypothetical protein
MDKDHNLATLSSPIDLSLAINFLEQAKQGTWFLEVPKPSTTSYLCW